MKVFVVSPVFAAFIVLVSVAGADPMEHTPFELSLHRRTADLGDPSSVLVFDNPNNGAIARRVWSPRRKRAPAAADAKEWEALLVRAAGGATDATGSDVSVRLYGGAYSVDEAVYLQATVGGAKFNVQVDTGSSDMAVPAVGCAACNYTDSPYAPSKSKTSQSVSCHDSRYDGCSCTGGGQCQYTISYVDNSGYTAALWSDTLGIEGTKLSGTGLVGAISSETGWSDKVMEGIWGVAFGPASQVGADTSLASVLSASALDEVFALCIEREGGSMVLGGYAAEDDAEPDWVPLVYSEGAPSGGYWTINAVGMEVDGRKVDVSARTLNSGLCIVDSGTTDIIIPNSALKAAFVTTQGCCNSKNLVGVCNTTFADSLFNGYCYEMSQADVDAFPTLSFLVGDAANPARLDLTPSDYLEYGDDGDYACINLTGGDESDGTILGEMLMQRFQVIFDRDDLSNARVGFLPKDACHSTLQRRQPPSL